MATFRTRLDRFCSGLPLMKFRQRILYQDQYFVFDRHGGSWAACGSTVFRICGGHSSPAPHCFMGEASAHGTQQLLRGILRQASCTAGNQSGPLPFQLPHFAPVRCGTAPRMPEPSSPRRWRLGALIMDERRGRTRGCDEVGEGEHPSARYVRAAQVKNGLCPALVRTTEFREPPIKSLPSISSGTMKRLGPVLWRAGIKSGLIHLIRFFLWGGGPRGARREGHVAPPVSYTFKRKWGR